MKILHLFLIALCVITSTVCGANSNKKSTPYGVFKTKDELRKYEHRVYSISNRHKFKLSGYIIDENGKPVNGVKMEVDLSNNAWTWHGSKYSTKSDGDKFKVDTAKCRSTSVRFIKKGYYPASLKASYDDITQSNMKYNFKYDGKNTIMADKIKVVMISIGMIPKTLGLHELEHISCKLINDEFNLHVIKIPGPQRDKYQYFKVKNLKSLPNDVIYAIPKIENGKIKKKKVYFNINDKPKGLIEIPYSITIKTNDKNGGFIRIMNPAEKYQFRMMKQAPENGYQQELILDDFKYIGGLKRIHFYFKINNYYGKMVITDIYKRLDRDGIGVRGWVVINQILNNRNTNSYEAHPW